MKLVLRSNEELADNNGRSDKNQTDKQDPEPVSSLEESSEKHSSSVTGRMRFVFIGSLGRIRLRGIFRNPAGNNRPNDGEGDPFQEQSIRDQPRSRGEGGMKAYYDRACDEL